MNNYFPVRSDQNTDHEPDHFNIFSAYNQNSSVITQTSQNTFTSEFASKRNQNANTSTLNISIQQGDPNLKKKEANSGQNTIDFYNELAVPKSQKPVRRSSRSRMTNSRTQTSTKKVSNSKSRSLAGKEGGLQMSPDKYKAQGRIVQNPSANTIGFNLNK